MKVLKWVITLIVVVIVLAIAALMIMRPITDGRVMEEISSNPQGERAGIVMVLTFADGKQIPVNYLREQNQVFVGADGPWWRSFKGDGQPVSLLIRGEHLAGHARTILDDQDYTDQIFSRLRPTVPEWLPDWANGKLIVIDLVTPADTASDNVLTTQEQEQGWQLLFDGQSLSAWRSYQSEQPNPRWIVQDHALTLSGGGGGDLGGVGGGVVVVVVDVGGHGRRVGLRPAAAPAAHFQVVVGSLLDL